MGRLSVIINTLNEETNLPKAISSVKDLADEIVVVDMGSSDNTVEVARKLGAKVFFHKKVGYVEPARNFAVSKATGEWILVLDADERIPERLLRKIRKLISQGEADYYRIPRKNIIFGKWIKHTLWWPDYQIRLFKKGKVAWSEIIHAIPTTAGRGGDLKAKEAFAILHYNYRSLGQYLARMDRYTSIQADFLVSESYRFIWKDLVKRPVKEFIGRYFMGEGYKDGAHGLALSLLQAFSELVTYIKVWEKEKFLEQSISEREVILEVKTSQKEIAWWLDEIKLKKGNLLEKAVIKLKRRVKNA